jgi:16S rRNA (cytosine967-C5)-methyltransferase
VVVKGVAARQLAVEVLAKVESEKVFAKPALNAEFEKRQMSERDKAFATALVQGVLRHRDELDNAIKKVSSQPMAKMPGKVKNNLRVAIYQLRYMDDIPSQAVLNTATEIGKTTGHVGIGKFVAGVLRGYLREADNMPAEPAELSERYSIPTWLIDRWRARYGEEEMNALLAYSQSIPQLTVRACESGITPEALYNVFKSSDIVAHHGELVDACLIIEDRGKFKGPIEKLPGYKEGLFIVQDEAAAFVSKVIDAKPGDAIVDLCAAPGGKTINMAEAMENKGRVVAVDIQEGRLELLKRTRQRVGLTNIEIFVADGTTFQLDRKVDKVLLDAPCTGTGVINRRSDLRFQRSAPDVAALVELQRKLLENAANMLKGGGVLVYATCSLEPEENEENLEWFLKNHAEFKPLSIAEYVPEKILDLDREAFERGWIQLRPTKHGVSGFFVAKLVKDADPEPEPEPEPTAES